MGVGVTPDRGTVCAKTQGCESALPGLRKAQQLYQRLGCVKGTRLQTLVGVCIRELFTNTRGQREYCSQVSLPACTQSVQFCPLILDSANGWL